MTKEKLYQYLGVNGTITSPVLLEGIYHVTKVRLIADPGKYLTKYNNEKELSIIVSEAEADEWSEIGQKTL